MNTLTRITRIMQQIVRLDAPMTPSANGHYVSMVAHTAALRRTVRDPARSPHYPRSLGLAEWWDSLMFMTTDARVRSSWVTFEPPSASCSGQPHRQGAPPLE